MSVSSQYGYAVSEEGIRKGDILIRDIEELEKLGRVRIHTQRLILKEIITLKNAGLWKFPIAEDAVKLSGRKSTTSENPLKYGINLQDVTISGEIFRKVRRSLHQQMKEKMTLSHRLLGFHYSSSCRISRSALRVRKKKLSQFLWNTWRIQRIW